MQLLDRTNGPIPDIDFELPQAPAQSGVDVELPLAVPAARPRSAFGRFAPTLSQVAAYPLRQKLRWPGLAHAGYPDARCWNWMRDGHVGLSERAAGGL